MRGLLLPRYERFSFEDAEIGGKPVLQHESKNLSVNDGIDVISERFNSYLQEAGIYATAKASLMGPVGKILEQAKVKGLDAEFLKGYAISTHKNTVKKTLGSTLLIPFEEGIDLLSTLLKRVPRHLRPKVIEIISYKVYYRREKANVEFWEKWRTDLVEFLRSKFANDFSKLKKETKLQDKINGREIKDFGAVIYISKKQRTEELQKIIAEFIEKRKETVIEEDEEEE